MTFRRAVAVLRAAMCIWTVALPVACGHARAPDVIPDAGPAAPSTSDGSTGNDAGDVADGSTRRVLLSEADFLARAAAAYHVERSDLKTAPFRVDLERPDGGAACFRVLVASDAPIDVHLEDAVGMRGPETHGIDALVPADGALCLAAGAHATFEARGTANVRFAVVSER